MNDGRSFHEPLGMRGNVTIDLFFALADAPAPAVGVVLSGADGDGSCGLKRLRRGLETVRGNRRRTRFSAALGDLTGMVDWILPADQIPRAWSLREKRSARLPETIAPLKRCRRRNATPMSMPAAGRQELCAIMASSRKCARRSRFLAL